MIYVDKLIKVFSGVTFMSCHHQLLNHIFSAELFCLSTVILKEFVFCYLEGIADFYGRLSVCNDCNIIRLDPLLLCCL